MCIYILLNHLIYFIKENIIMFYSFSKISFHIIIHLFVIHISSAIPSGDDKMLIAFVRNDQKMRISEYSMEKYEAHLGILYYMRKNWKCNKIAKEFEEYERTECQKYRKYLDILYEYLSREYVGIPTVKPKFIYKAHRINETEIEGPLIYAVNCLAKISQFYLNGEESEFNEYKLNKLFNSIDWLFQPKLWNENRLNYELKFENEQKIPINEMILQLAIYTANECQTNESLDGIIKQNFNKNLEEMFKKVDESGKEEEGEEEEYYDVYTINNAEEFDDASIWIDDALFLEFVKGYGATDFKKFTKLIKVYNNREKVNEDDLMQQYEAHFCVVYLIKNNWHQREAICEDNINCQMYRKYLHILYEYLFRLYAEAKSPNESTQLSPMMKPIFIGASGKALSLFDVVINLNYVAKFSCNQTFNWARDVMELVNEVELNFIEKNKDALNESTDLNESMDLSQSTDTDQIIKKEFEQKMKLNCDGKSKELEEIFWSIG